MELAYSINEVAGGISAMAPKIIVALLFIIVGWIFGAAVGRVIQQLVDALKIDMWLSKAGVDKFFDRSGYRLNSGAFLGWLAKLFFVVVFLIAAFEILGLTQVNDFLRQVINYIPQVVVAMVVLFIASVAADIVSSVISGMTRAVGSQVAHLLASFTRWTIWIFAIIIALSHLGIAPQYMYTLFAGFIAMLALSGGLAFGLGGRDAASDLIKELRSEVREGRKEGL